jgi:medium-chain acyl-[acyl-carrier-protein] hydrolase
MEHFTHNASTSSETDAAQLWLFGSAPNIHDRCRLFCLPYAGGGASFFYPGWKNFPLPYVNVYPIQLPGRENRSAESPFVRMEPLIEALGKTLHPYLDVPFAFFGHSMGAKLAFELCRFLRSEYNLTPIHLFASAHDAPQISHKGPQLHRLSNDVFLEHIRLRYGGIPQIILNEPELLTFFVAILRADFEMLETYSYKPDAPLSCSISVFGGLQDERTIQASLNAWSEQTNAAFQLRMFPGGHFFLRDVRKELLQKIAEDLEISFPVEESTQSQHGGNQPTYRP